VLSKEHCTLTDVQGLFCGADKSRTASRLRDQVSERASELVVSKQHFSTDNAIQCYKRQKLKKSLRRRVRSTTRISHN